MDVYDFQRLYKPFLFLFKKKKKCFTSFVTFVTVLTQAHEACGPMEIDSALTAIQTLRSELQDARAAAASEQLKPLPGESVSDVLLNSDTQEFAIEHRTDSDSVFLLSRSRFFFLSLLLQLEKCAQDLGSTSKAVGSSMAQLLTCAAQGNEHYTGWCWR